MEQETTMTATTTAVHEALALLDAYEDDPELALSVEDPGPLSIKSSASRLEDPASPGVAAGGHGHHHHTQKTTRDRKRLSGSNKEVCRFKGARQRRKNELAFYRDRVRELEAQVLALRAQQQQQEQQHCNSSYSTTGTGLVAQLAAPSAWQVTAKRQKRLRREAEALNRQLKATAKENLQHTQQLERLLLRRPADKTVLHHHKVKRPYLDHARDAQANAVALDHLIVHLDLFQREIGAIVDSFSGYRYPSTGAAVVGAGFDGGCGDGSVFLEVKIREAATGCGFAVGGMFCRVLPHEVKVTSANMWQLLAFEDDGVFSVPHAQVLNDHDAMVTQMYWMDVHDGLWRGSHFLFVLVRKVVTANGVTISWAGSSGLNKCGAQNNCTVARGFVTITPSQVKPATESVVQSYYCISQESCQDGACNCRLCPELTRKESLSYIAKCVSDAIQARVQSAEDAMLGLAVPVRPAH